MNAARQARQAAKEADPAGELKKQLRIKTGTFARYSYLGQQNLKR
jgi:hypothetical protein